MSLQDLSVHNLFNVRGKIALVTGGGTGIGKMIASGLVANGAKVYIAARKEEQLRKTADELNKAGPGTCHIIVANLGDKAGCDALSDEFKKRELKLHILVNNSGATWGAPYDNFPEKEGWDRVFALNIKAIFYLTVGLTELLAKDSTAADPGRVINISSMAGVSAHVEGTELANGDAGVWSYNTSKAAANSLTGSLAVKLVRRLITVNSIMPGIFPSRMTAFGYRMTGEDKMNSNQPTGRVGQASDIAGTTLFLCSPASAHVTGANISLDGGKALSGMRVNPAARL